MLHCCCVKDWLHYCSFNAGDFSYLYIPVPHAESEVVGDMLDPHSACSNTILRSKAIPQRSFLSRHSSKCTSSPPRANLRMSRAVGDMPLAGKIVAVTGGGSGVFFRASSLSSSMPRLPLFQSQRNDHVANYLYSQASGSLLSSIPSTKALEALS